MTVYPLNLIGNTVDVIAENIPHILKRRTQWVNWRPEERNGKLTKVPYNPHTRRKASSTDLSTWTGFEEVIEALKTARFNGIGFVFSSGDCFTGIDFDECRDPQTGDIADWAQEWIEQLDSYTEVSPSGTGLHVIVRGKSAHNGKRTVDGKTVEIYSTERFFTITGVLP